MKNLNPKIIQHVLGIYSPNWKFLKSVSLEDKTYYGAFELNNQCQYLSSLSKGFNHATEIELDACISQLCYASIADMISKNQIKQFENYNFSSLQENGVLAVESNKRFRKIIPRAEFKGQIELNEVREESDLSILKYTGNFNNHSMVIDSLRIILKKF